MTWQQFQGEIIRVRQMKTSALLDIACHTRLRTHLEERRRKLDASKKRGLLICAGASGRPYNANSLASAIYRAVQAIDEMPKDRSLHGLRYASGSAMEEAGCTVGEIEAVLGHRTFKMALKYASQRLRAKAAIAKLEAAAKE
jgi:integrase